MKKRAEIAVTGTELKEQYKKSIGRTVFFILTPSFLVLISGISASLGSANIPIWDTYFAFLHKFSSDRMVAVGISGIDDHDHGVSLQLPG